MIKLLIFTLINIIVNPLQIITDICRITYDQNGQLINLISCEQIDACISGQEGSGSQCGQYSYKPLSFQGDCTSTCCPQMQINVLETIEEVQQCYNQYRIRQILRIGLIIFFILLAVGVLMAIGLTCIFGYQRNPYTGQRKYVGCCCCKKPPNFQTQPQNAQNGQNNKQIKNYMQQPQTDNHL